MLDALGLAIGDISIFLVDDAGDAPSTDLGNVAVADDDTVIVVDDTTAVDSGPQETSPYAGQWRYGQDGDDGTDEYANTQHIDEPTPTIYLNHNAIDGLKSLEDVAAGWTFVCTDNTNSGLTLSGTVTGVLQGAPGYCFEYTETGRTGFVHQLTGTFTCVLTPP